MLVLGDAHADDPDNRRALFAAYRESDADVALQLGDLLYYDLPIPTYFIAGNNEDFDVIDALRHGRVESSDVTNAFLIADEAVEVDGLRVAGLSGNYAPTQYERPRPNLQGERRRHFVREDVEAVKQLDDVDVLLTHEAPHGLPVSESYEVGCEYIDELIEAVEPRLCLVGHHHQHAETTYGDTRVVGIASVGKRYYELDPATLELTSYPTPPS
ncbi:metallophosphoesterase [Halorussus limi]|uniref:Metallophosphoesterase n=1 Tax=Halorussus limi TaxID=2938695 RepID=A0A8U0HQT8_9EURY|nr:metallophosphoesterase [Halorussus limi]UPV73267.1 metallophosphoesterase [Halorussus limi]